MGKMHTLNPFVYWAQNERTVFLKIDLIDVQNPHAEIGATSLDFGCQGSGAKGNNNYHLHLDFYDELNKKESHYKVLGTHVAFILAKAKHDWWPRLVPQPQKPSWLKIDFDRWQSPDDMNDDEQVGDILKDRNDIFNRLQKEEIGYRKEDLRKVYLTCYNFVMYLGFLYICIVLLMKYLKDGTDFFPKAFENVGTPLYILQGTQLMEIVHPLLGIMKGGAFMPFVQIFGRCFVLFVMVGSEPKIQIESVVFFLIVTWCSIEIIRYPFYITQLFKRDNKMLTWLRYNAWIILYPIGFTCETIVCYKHLIILDQSKRWSIEMPNPVNFTFSSAFMLRFYILIITFPGMMVLLGHMYRARRQRLYGKLKRK